MIKTVRPKLELLSKKFVEKIIDEAYIILENPGIFVENKQALRFFGDAGQKVDNRTQRVRIKRSLVERCLLTGAVTRNSSSEETRSTLIRARPGSPFSITPPARRESPKPRTSSHLQ